MCNYMEENVYAVGWMEKEERAVWLGHSLPPCIAKRTYPTTRPGDSKAKAVVERFMQELSGDAIENAEIFLNQLLVFLDRYGHLNPDDFDALLFKELGV